jgi:hypothetical protein
MRRAESAALLLVSILAAAAPAAAWTVRDDAPAADFSAFNRRFSADAYPYPRHGAAPLGLLGFDVWADVAADRGFGDQGFVDTTIDGSLTGGYLAVGRVGARKGLPGGLDVGLSYGRVLNGDVKLASAEVEYALLHGGLLEPALGLRVTGTRTVGAGAYDLHQYGAELLLSKGFTVLTPYVGVGIVQSRGRLDGTLRTLADTDTRGIAYAGVTLNLLLPKITVEVEKTDVVQGAVRVAFGL